jgi:hypothetical protein
MVDWDCKVLWFVGALALLLRSKNNVQNSGLRSLQHYPDGGRNFAGCKTSALVLIRRFPFARKTGDGVTGQLSETSMQKNGQLHGCRPVERRSITRTRISAPARVLIADSGSFAWDCRVRDITSRGARLEFADAPVIPTQFSLTFDSGKTLRGCDLIWRSANQAGVRFRLSQTRQW